MSIKNDSHEPSDSCLSSFTSLQLYRYFFGKITQLYIMPMSIADTVVHEVVSMSVEQSHSGRNTEVNYSILHSLAPLALSRATTSPFPFP